MSSQTGRHLARRMQGVRGINEHTAITTGSVLNKFDGRFKQLDVSSRHNRQNLGKCVPHIFISNAANAANATTTGTCKTSYNSPLRSGPLPAHSSWLSGRFLSISSSFTPFTRKQNLTTLPPKGTRSYVTKSSYDPVHIDTNLDLFSFLSENFESFKDKPFAIDGLTGHLTTHGQFREQAASVGSALVKRGLGVDDVVCICAQNCIEYAAMMIGCVGVGAAASPVNTANTAKELAVQMKMTSAKFLLITDDLHETAQKAVWGDPELHHVTIIIIGRPESSSKFPSNTIPYGDLLQDKGDAFPSAAERRRLISDPSSHVAILPFSSGTTGLPKGVQLTHLNLVANVTQVTSQDELMGPIKDGSRDRALALLPMWHIYQAFCSMVYMRNGTMMLTLPKFEPVSFLESISNHKLGLLPLVPPLILFLNKHPMVKGYDMSNVRDIVCAAAPLCEHLQKDVADQFGITRFRQGYGMTELSPIVTMGRTSEFKPGTCGVIVPNTEVKILPVEEEADSGKRGDLKEGETGEIVVKGPQVMKGYLNNPKATAEMINSEGWLHTGDIGSMKDGYLYVVDRMKELIKYKGHQVAPAELEGVLLLHPSVEDAAVIGIKDEVGGEVPRAFVVLKQGVESDAEAASSVRRFVDDQVNPLSRLRGGVEIIDAIPKSTSGKILRRTLRDRVSAGK